MAKGSRIWQVLLALVIACFVAYAVWCEKRKMHRDGQLLISIELVSAQRLECQLFFSSENAFIQRDAISAVYKGTGTVEVLSFVIPGAIDRVRHIRFDPGEHPFTVELHRISLEGPYHTIRWSGKELHDRFDDLNSLIETLNDQGNWNLESVAEDPYLSSSKDLGTDVRVVMDPTPPRAKPMLHAALAGALAFTILLLLFHWWPGVLNLPRPFRGLLSPVTFVLVAIDAFAFVIVLGLGLRRLQMIHEVRLLWSMILVALVAVLFVHRSVSRSVRTAVQNASARNMNFSTAFLICLVLPLACLFHPGLEASFPFSERRILAPEPSVQLNSIGEIPAQFDAWYRDHFPFRKALYRWNSLLYLRLLNTSPLPEAVLVGKQGKLFQYDRKVDHNYRGIPFFTFKDLERIRHTYEERQQWLAEQGIGFYLIIPPLSANLQPTYLPDNLHRLSDTTWLGQVSDHFKRYSPVPLIDLRADLLEAKDFPIYYDTDIHWNAYGAYFGYRKLMDRISQDRTDVGPAWPITDLRFDPRTDTHADLSELLGVQDILTREEMVVTPLRERTAEYDHSEPLPRFLRTNEPPQVFIDNDNVKPRLLMFHDSFGVSLRPLISQHFSTSVFVWSAVFYPEVVAIHKPNVVVQELMEMFVPDMLGDTLALP